ncbi:hypothetical protein G9A89_021693 [Geosiphon pyriformis]|nr:hypothetical protein G9A89_021693 [Geosiphon pyriformis]
MRAYDLHTYQFTQICQLPNLHTPQDFSSLEVPPSLRHDDDSLPPRSSYTGKTIPFGCHRTHGVPILTHPTHTAGQITGNSPWIHPKQTTHANQSKWTIFN